MVLTHKPWEWLVLDGPGQNHALTDPGNEKYRYLKGAIEKYVSRSKSNFSQ